MRVRAAVSQGLFWISLALLAGSLFLLLAPASPGEGFEDLARFAGALLLATAAGLGFSAHLLAAPARPHGWRLGVAVGGAIVGALVALLLGRVAFEAPNVGLLAFAALVVAAALGALWRVARRPNRAL